MLNLNYRTGPSNFAPAVFLIVIMALSFFSNRAFADTVILSGTHPPQDIKGACGGGTFTADGSGYSCVTSKGYVNCTWDYKCFGNCATCGPHVVKQGKNTVFGILGGTTLKIGTTAPAPGSTRTPIIAKPIVAKPVGDHPILERSGGDSSGKH